MNEQKKKCQRSVNLKECEVLLIVFGHQSAFLAEHWHCWALLMLKFRCASQQSHIAASPGTPDSTSQPMSLGFIVGFFFGSRGGGEGCSWGNPKDSVWEDWGSPNRED